MVMLPDLSRYTVLVAVTVTAFAAGTVDGAVYVAVYCPVPAMVPYVELPPATPSTDQAIVAGDKGTYAYNDRAVPTATLPPLYTVICANA